MRPLRCLAGSLLAIGLIFSEAVASGPELYQKHCAACHHAERYGLSGPPLIPEYFGMKKEHELSAIIARGLEATNMPGFKDALSEDEIREIVSFIRTPAATPAWGEKEMLSTLLISEAAARKAPPPHDMENFFMIVEGGTGKVHFMDGDTFKLIDSVKAGAIHGGPKFDKSLEHAFLVSRDGWVIRYDFAGMKETGRIRAGISARNIAVSSDSKRIAAATLLPSSIVIIDAATMKPVKTFSGLSVSSVYGLRKSGRFVAALKDRPELLLIDEKSLEVTRIDTGEPLTDFFIEPEERYIVGTSRKGESITIVDLAKAAVVKTLKSGVRMPHLASAAIWKDKGEVLAAFPHIGEASVSVLRLYDWEVVAGIKTKGPGFFARTHEYLPHIWVDTGTDTIQLIDKKTFEIAGEVVPEAGKKAMHVEFTKEGSFALVSVWEDDGAVKIYDARGLKVVKTLPFKKPVGKYNAANKRF